MRQDLAYFVGTDTRHVEVWQVKPDGGGSVVYFRLLCDTDDEAAAQTVGGDLMFLARSEAADGTSTAARGFVMRHTDSSYVWVFCIPAKEECDPHREVDLSKYLLICFFASFAVELGVFCVFRLLTAARRQREYEAQLAEQRRVLREMQAQDKTQQATRIGMRDVSKKRAAKIAKDKAELRELHRAQNKVTIDAALSYDANRAAQWTLHTHNDDEEEMAPQIVEMQELDGAQEEDGSLPEGWELHHAENGDVYYFDTLNQHTQWERP